MIYLRPRRRHSVDDVLYYTIFTSIWICEKTLINGGSVKCISYFQIVDLWQFRCIFGNESQYRYHLVVRTCVWRHQMMTWERSGGMGLSVECWLGEWCPLVWDSFPGMRCNSSIMAVCNINIATSGVRALLALIGKSARGHDRYNDYRRIKMKLPM